jgi:predicted secreted protein
MTVFSGIVAFLLIWWLVLFTVLPLGVKTPEEAGEAQVPGTPASAPVRPRVVRKMALTTVITGLIWGAFWWAKTTGLLSLG